MLARPKEGTGDHERARQRAARARAVREDFLKARVDVSTVVREGARGYSVTGRCCPRDGPGRRASRDQRYLDAQEGFDSPKSALRDLGDKWPTRDALFHAGRGRQRALVRARDLGARWLRGDGGGRGWRRDRLGGRRAAAGMSAEDRNKG